MKQVEIKHIVTLAFMACSLVFFGQTKKYLTVQMGKQFFQYTISDNQHIHSVSSAWDWPKRIGLIWQRKNSSQSFGLELVNMKMALPAWPPSGDQIFYGPNFIVSGFYAFERSIIGNHTSLVFLDFGLNPTFGFIPQYYSNREAVKINPFTNGITYNDEAGNIIYDERSRQRLTNLFYGAIDIHLVLGVNLNNYIQMSFLPVYNVGLWNIFKDDFNYTIRDGNIAGSGVIKSRGSSNGFQFRFSVLLERRVFND